MERLLRRCLHRQRPAGPPRILRTVRCRGRRRRRMAAHARAGASWCSRFLWTRTRAARTVRSLIEMPPGAISLEGFTWRPLGRRAPVIDTLDLRVEPGERVLLAGPSGAGKSTVLHALVGALGSTLPGDLGGQVSVGGRVGLVPQTPGDAVVAEHIGRDVAFGPENLALSRDVIWSRVDEALE